MARTRVNTKLSLVLLLGGLALGLVFFYLNRQEDRQGAFSDIPFEMELEDFELIHGSRGRKVWQLKAKGSKYDKTEEIVRLVAPDFLFFQDDEHGDVRVRSQYGRLERNKGRIVLWPRVRAEYEKTRIAADRMEYEEAYDELVFYGDVAVHSPEMVIHSQNGVFDMESRTVKLWGAVEVVLGEELQKKNIE